MGFSSSKEKKPKENKQVEIPITAQDLKNLLNISQIKCTLYHNKRTHMIKNLKEEIVNYLNQNKIDLVKALIDTILKCENDIAIYDSLEPIIEIVKEKCNYIIHNDECPTDLRSPLDTLLYTATRLDIDELNLFREKIIKKYGLDYVNNADKNIKKLVNEDLVEKLQPKLYSEISIKMKLNQICKEKNIKNPVIEEGVYVDNLLSPELLNINPYESTKEKFPMPEDDNKKDKFDIKINIEESGFKRDNPDDMDKVFTRVTSNTNGIFCKTKVTQLFSNPYDTPLELKIYILKTDKIIFSSFECQIGKSIKVKSKVIKEEKAQEKYEDSIASGNAAIFVAHDPYDKNKIIINMGNLPPKEDIIFISNYINQIENSNDRYELELFRNLPIFQDKNGDIYQNSELKGELIIESHNEIIDIKKETLMKNLQIVKEDLYSPNPYDFRFKLKYKIEEIPVFSFNNLEYIPSSKIYFNLKNNQPLVIYQESNKILNENYYFIQCNFKLDEINNQKQEMSPSLFIFLIDQSGSMSGTSIKIASKALMIFLQSIPVGSYYQIIGFGSEFKKYDETPKEYNKENIQKSIDIIKNLDAVLGGTDIYQPLNFIFNSNDYDNINLPRNIFLLTDGEVDDKNRVLNLIEANNTKFTIYSIGIGNYFDEDLIKNAGIIGKGNYNFCKDLNKLNSIIVSEINKCCYPFIEDIKLDCNLDKNNNKNIVNNIPKILGYNQILNLYYITNNNIIDNIKLDIKYKDQKNNKYNKNYQIIPEKLEKGDELSKLIIYNYIKNDNKLSYEEKIKLALKYQILIEGTSLFAEVELDNKISEEMKLQILGDKKQKVIRPKIKYCADEAPENLLFSGSPFDGANSYKHINMDLMCQKQMCADFGDIDDMREESNNCYELDPFGGEMEDLQNYNEEKELQNDFMEIINTQDFIEGYWEENEKTKKIIEKYEKEYKLIKELKNKKIDEKTAVTILMIYFIYKEHSNSLNDLLLIIKKAEMFIQRVLNDSYENIIKEININ